jgi:hypothetical protein
MRADRQSTLWSLTCYRVVALLALLLLLLLLQGRDAPVRPSDSHGHLRPWRKQSYCNIRCGIKEPGSGDGSAAAAPAGICAATTAQQPPGQVGRSAGTQRSRLDVCICEINQLKIWITCT